MNSHTEDRISWTGGSQGDSGRGGIREGCRTGFKRHWPIPRKMTQSNRGFRGFQTMVALVGDATSGEPATAAKDRTETALFASSRSTCWVQMDAGNLLHQGHSRTTGPRDFKSDRLGTKTSRAFLVRHTTSQLSKC